MVVVVVVVVGAAFPSLRQCSRSVLRYFANVYARDLAVHLLRAHLHEHSGCVELEVDDLAAREAYGHLPGVEGAPLNRLLSGCLPLADPSIGANVPNASVVDLEERVVGEEADRERGRGREEPAVRDLLDGVPDRED